MRARVVTAWVIAAILGITIAATLTLAASQLSSQRIGLSGEPLSAGDELAPRVATTSSIPARGPSARQSARPARRPSGSRSVLAPSPRSEEQGEASDGDD